MSLSPSGEPREPLPGTVKLYERHIFVCTGRVGWPGHIEEDGGFVQALSEAIAGAGDRIARTVKVTACDEPPVRGEGYDLLVFPDAVRYVAVRDPDIPAFVEDHLVSDRPSDRLEHTELRGKHVFVCIHANRDVRCGRCGPPVARRFRDLLQERGLEDEVTVRRTSHVGQHSLAANVLVYPGGDWYGYVTPDDVPRIVDEHLQSGEIVGDLWRGRMGTTPEEQRALASQWG
ncbi:MAG TPA: sucrase/ferredoxin-like family protein [Actinomycetota bacterium]|nr:sucrase/ferredoxin-like family protein [Actinomycetota bacterium]